MLISFYSRDKSAWENAHPTRTAKARRKNVYATEHAACLASNQVCLISWSISDFNIFIKALGNCAEHVSYVTINVADRECPEPEQIAFGSVTASGKLFGARATYSCQHGYHVVGLQSRTCQADGKWAGSPPACKQNSRFSFVKHCPLIL